MRYHDVIADVSRLARSQYGVISRPQALSSGLTAKIIQSVVERGEWVHLSPRVYALTAFPSSWQRQYKAAELSVRGAALAGLAAAKVHDFEGFRVVRPEVVAGHTCVHRTPLATVHRSENTISTTRDRFRVTTAAQTLFDILPRIHLSRWERACDDLLLTGRLSLAELQERQAALRASRRPGIATFRALVTEREVDGWAPTESVLEQHLRRAVAAVAGLPPVRWQAPLPWREAGAGRVDGLVEAWGLVLEADGRRWHQRMEKHDEDRWRDNQPWPPGSGCSDSPIHISPSASTRLSRSSPRPERNHIQRRLS